MKKLLLSVFALSAYITVNAQCSDIFISEYSEGTYNNKALELYNPTNHAIAFNNNYRMVRYNNGTTAAAGENNPQAMISLGTHVMAPYSTWVIVIDRRDTTITTGTDVVVASGLRAIADTFLCNNYLTSYTMNFNGNDAISVQKTADGGVTWSYVDIFGMMGDPAMVLAQSWSDQYPYDGSAGAWWTLNHTLIRKSSVTGGVTANPSTEFIVTAEYDSLPENDWSNLHIHSCTCFTGIDENSNSVSMNVYPNPANSGYAVISAGETIETAELYNVVGQKVFSKQGNKTAKMTIETASLPKGIYIVKAQFAKQKTGTVKLSVQ